MWMAAQSYIALSARGVEITWAKGKAPDIAGYDVLIANNEGGPYTKLNSNLLTSTRYLTPELRYGSYFFIVTSIDRRGNKSLRSLPAKVDII